jgi:nucleoside-diphosphate-sugar epimerase
MKVFIAGATGVLGRRAVTAMIQRGHDVTGVARSAEKAGLLRELGAAAAAVDLFDSDAVRRAVEGHDAVVHCATSIPSPARMGLRRAWLTNDRLRAEATPILAAAAGAAGASVFVKESVTFAYDDGGDAWLDESAPLTAVANLSSGSVAERVAEHFTDPAADRRGIVLRYGMFYGPDSASTIATVKAARRGLATALSSRQAFASSIHTDDAATALAAALDVPAGTYNVVDDEPVTWEDYVAALAAALGRRRLRFPPAILVKAGTRSSPALARSQRVSNRKFREASGWTPRYPSVREGWLAVVAALAAGPAGPADGPAQAVR